MGFLTTFTTYLIVFHGMEFAFPSGKNALAQSGENKVVYGDFGYPPLEPGHELEHMQAIDQLENIYDRALLEFLSIKGSTDPALTSSRTATARVNLYGFSRCAFAIPISMGGSSTMVEILKRYVSKAAAQPSWINNYLLDQLNRSIDIFNLVITPAKGAEGLYNIENWPQSYIDGCTVFNRY